MTDPWAVVETESDAHPSEAPPAEDDIISEHGCPSESDAEGDLRLRPATMDSEVHPPPALSGCAWWQDPLWRALEAWRRKRPLIATRSMCHVAICAGAMTEAYSFKAWLLPGARNISPLSDSINVPGNIEAPLDKLVSSVTTAGSISAVVTRWDCPGRAPRHDGLPMCLGSAFRGEMRLLRDVGERG